MLSEKMIERLNEQICSEIYSASLHVGVRLQHVHPDERLFQPDRYDYKKHQNRKN